MIAALVMAQVLSSVVIMLIYIFFSILSVIRIVCLLLVMFSSVTEIVWGLCLWPLIDTG